MIYLEKLLPEIDIDWVAYFHQFCTIHGEPIRWGGRLLFPDGWQYSATNYEGPEWPPPEGRELVKLGLIYWSKRRGFVRYQIEGYTKILANLQEDMQRRSAPLQHRITEIGEDGKINRETRVLSLEPLQARLDWLHKDLEDCDRQLTELKERWQSS